MTPKECANLVARLLGAFPTQHQKMSREDVHWMTASYIAGLIDLDFELASRAVDRVNKTADWIPKIAEIRREAAEISLGGQRSGAEAWGDVMAMVRKKGVYGDPVFADPLVAEAVASIGWRAICMASETDPSTRARFAEAYTRLASAARKAAQLAPGGGGHAALPAGAAGRLPAMSAPRTRVTSAREGKQMAAGDLVRGLLPQGDDDVDDA